MSLSYLKLKTEPIMYSFVYIITDKGKIKNVVPQTLTQHAKKVVSNSLGLVDFAIGLVFFVLNLPDGQVLFFGEVQIQSGQSKRVLGIVRLTCGLVHAIYSLPKWQAVKLIFFAPCTYPMSRGLSIFLDSVEKEESKDPCSQGTKPKNSNQRPFRNKSSGVQVHCSRKLLYYMADCQSNQNSQVLHKYCNNFYKYMFKFNFKFIKTLWIYNYHNH